MDFEAKWRGLVDISQVVCAHDLCPNGCGTKIVRSGSSLFLLLKRSDHLRRPLFLLGHFPFLPSLAQKGYIPLPRIRMVGDEVTLATANPKLYVKVSLHTAFQCMVI